MVATPSRPTISLPSDQQASGRTLGEEEILKVAEAIRSGTLTSTKGTMVKQLEKRFAEMLGVKYAYACASGSGAIHCAVAAIDPEPGDEIITTSITDMGGLTPILYQGAIPVFADVDPNTWNVTAETIEQCITERTKAIVVTHIFGNPCEMTAIMELANSRGIPVIEDCAQAYLATCKEQPVGTIGAVGCFSLQQGKHITTGEGGLVVTNDDALAHRLFLFINKGFDYGNLSQPDHYFIALNNRMCELQGAVALAQMDKLEGCVSNRQAAADKLTAKLQGIPGLLPPVHADDSTHVYWKYALRVDKNVIRDGAVGLAKRLKEEKGIFSAPRYIQKPAFQCIIFEEQRTFGNSRWPFTLATPEAVDYNPEKFPGTFSGLEWVLVLPWNENYTDEHIDYIAASVREVAGDLTI
ncbi:DegT/DnrJ/EryC1/StrS family aminotransferase [filamentous cyanobacterium LEGE 11480]|uniref:DegT/DnrJ/EryC1/StrS family aminotransferase n=1 Tax=Romeriopsis navalis LEGE 11480 TaxID=2777977 RepID=A0A928VSW5_9CYAN|nr:DegT/DnrJ/EryC1/StrS family aminotransferase [Romeriopsis navalis]MBE9031942.1 DegT/DnrJ/EryC1/StrS family aminotransferase [Romeriopsis navalis LEGE 11480]